MPLHRRCLPLFLLCATIVLAWPARAFPDDEARRAILELREQMRQMGDRQRQTQLQLADQLDILRQEVATLRGQVEQLSWQAGGQRSPAARINQVTDPMEQAAFDAAQAHYRAGAYADALTGFDAFLDGYPASSLAPEARFLHGSSLYATKQFKPAIDSLQRLLSATPEHARAPDALLVIAAAQTELNDLRGARASLQRIVKEYPQSAVAATAQERLELLR